MAGVYQDTPLMIDASTGQITLATTEGYRIGFLANYADDAAAAAGGILINGIHRSGSALKVRVS